MGVKDKMESPISPIIFKFGVALVVSLSGIVYTFFRIKRISPFKPKPPLPSPGKGSLADSRGGNGDNRDLPNSVNELSTANRSVVDRGGFLLSELDQLIKEYDIAPDDVSSRMNRQSLESTNGYKYGEHDECNREISSLSCKVKLLEEREKVLENQLLEYYGLKEQETV